jgi:hypothetical protein
MLGTLRVSSSLRPQPHQRQTSYRATLAFNGESANFPRSCCNIRGRFMSRNPSASIYILDAFTCAQYGDLLGIYVNVKTGIRSVVSTIHDGFMFNSSILDRLIHELYHTQKGNATSNQNAGGISNAHNPQKWYRINHIPQLKRLDCTETKWLENAQSSE